jgi:diaminopimelate epimerase
MTGTLSFVKMSGTGNDFIMVDNREGRVPESEKAALAERLCDRRRAIGGDGLILLEQPAPSVDADIRMRIINADGSEAEMCGNGARCLARFARSVSAVGTEMTVQTLAGVIAASVDGMSVLVDLTKPTAIESKGELEFAGTTSEVWYTDTGVPHAVVFVTDVERVDVRALGKALRFHEAFRPRGANANFVGVDGVGRIHVRTYERGVEDETLACGTGSTAAALVTAAREGWSSPVTVKVRSGEELVVHFKGSPPGYESAALGGAVTVSFTGSVEVNGLTDD